MLGKIPFVSISDRRLGGIENSSLRYLSAMRAFEFSTSRIVSPSFSRRVRRLFPAGSMRSASKGVGNHTKVRKIFVQLCNFFLHPPSVTFSEQAPSLVSYGDWAHSALLVP